MTLVAPELWTLNEDRRRGHRIDAYEKATLVLRDLRSGSWHLTGVPLDHPAAPDLEAGGGIIAFHRGEVLFSGRVEFFEDVEEVDSDGDATEAKEVSGSSHYAIVEDAKTHPSPADLDWSAAETKLYDDVGETAIKAVLNDNIGPGAHPSRVVTGLAIATDHGRGSDVRDEVRFDDLGELVAGWCTRAGLLPSLVVSNGSFLFDVTVPKDRSAEVHFGIARGTARRVVRSERAPTLNFEWVGGQGEGVARQFVGGGDAASMLRWKMRREEIRDRRDTNDTAVLEAQLAEDLAAGASSRAYLVEPIDGGEYAYGVDYRLGDFVTVRTRNGLIVQGIREVTVEIDADRVVTFTPLVADPFTPPPTDLAVFGQVRALRSRLVTQEAR